MVVKQVTGNPNYDHGYPRTLVKARRGPFIGYDTAQLMLNLTFYGLALG